MLLATETAAQAAGDNVGSIAASVNGEVKLVESEVAVVVARTGGLELEVNVRILTAIVVVIDEENGFGHPPLRCT
jgi:hypothetical protein